MKWRKLNRILHRDLGYFFFGMTIIYAVSGIVLNHKSHGGDASIVTRSENFTYNPTQKNSINMEFISSLLKQLDIPDSNFKSYYFKSENKLMIYLKDGHISYNYQNGSGEVINIKKRPVLYSFNFLHYNKPKKIWTWFSDIFAISLGLVAITGLFILKGKHGITRRGAILVSLGLLIPAMFLFFYMHSV